jgi:hypothetical protein
MPGLREIVRHMPREHRVLLQLLANRGLPTVLLQLAAVIVGDLGLGLTLAQKLPRTPSGLHMLELFTGEAALDGRKTHTLAHGGSPVSLESRDPVGCRAAWRLVE